MTLRWFPIGPFLLPGFEEIERLLAIPFESLHEWLGGDDGEAESCQGPESGMKLHPITLRENWTRRKIHNGRIRGCHFSLRAVSDFL